MFKMIMNNIRNKYILIVVKMSHYKQIYVNFQNKWMYSMFLIAIMIVNLFVD